MFWPFFLVISKYQLWLINYEHKLMLVYQLLSNSKTNRCQNCAQITHNNAIKINSCIYRLTMMSMHVLANQINKLYFKYYKKDLWVVFNSTILLTIIITIFYFKMYLSTQSWKILNSTVIYRKLAEPSCNCNGRRQYCFNMNHVGRIFEKHKWYKHVLNN